LGGALSPRKGQAFLAGKPCWKATETAAQARADCLAGTYTATENAVWHGESDICSI
jgi:hypothetical protein